MQPDFTKLKPVGGTPNFATLKPVVPQTNTDASVSTPTLDSKLSNMGGVLGSIGSGIYNAGKGLLKLGGSAIADTFQAINHPIDSAVTVGKFLGGELQGGADPTQLDTLGNFVQGTVGSKGLLGAAQLPGRVAYDVMHPEDRQLTQKKILGTTLNAALTALTFGEGNIGSQAIEQSVKQGLLTNTVGQALKTGATSFLGRAVQSGGIMSGFQVGSNLQEGRPVGEGVKQAFFSGLAVPGLIEGTGKALGKITPNVSTNGADLLRRSIGFRGTNPKEIKQFNESAPIVYDTLKKSGFKVPDSTDPNNLINLDKAVQDSMTNILKERTARIQAVGGDATISGDLAANKIRNLIEPSSVEDLTNPSAREKLDAIAKNFEGKKYLPEDAQKAIIQANTGFSFSDNPAMSKQIKMAISQAFTPELDRIVGGADKVAVDAKGKPIPAIGGTAELNKKWSAFKSFQDQLQKKINIEDRKSSFSLPDRLTGAEIAGKIGEAVGNPMKIPEKIVGGGFEYLANKIMGDRNNVNYRIYKAFNGQPIGVGVVNLLNKFTKASDIVKLLEQNPLISHLLDKILPTDPKLQNTSPEWAKNRQGGYIKNPLVGETKISVTPESVANKLGEGDMRIIRSVVSGNLNDYIKAQPMLKAMGIDSLSTQDQVRFLEEVIANSTKSLPVNKK